MKRCENNNCMMLGIRVPEEFYFCEKCGRELANALKCKCGKEIPTFSHYCPYCSEEVTK